MTRFRKLDDIQAADLPLVGVKAFSLAQLKQAGLPVAPGWVLPATAWHTHLKAVVWPLELANGGLGRLQITAFKQLQQTSQAWQKALAAATPPTLEPPPWGNQGCGWMLRSSMWLEATSSPQSSGGLLPAVVGTTDCDLSLGIRQFWGQALTARNLVVWQSYCQHLSDLGLATLAMPLYPAMASGTFDLSPAQADVRVVQGLGLALSRGEAIPARGHLDLNQAHPVQWDDGFQDQVYSPRFPAADPAPPAPLAHSLVVTQRPQGRLQGDSLLKREHVERLLSLAKQVQALMHCPTLRLEWLLCPGPEGEAETILLTQVDLHPDSPWLTRPQLSARETLPPPSLPEVSTVVRGIGAAAGRVQGQAMVASRPQDLPNPLPPGCIVVLPDLQPDVFLRLQAVAGIVTEQGGATCHAAILAREMGVPAVVGVPQATQLLDHGALVWLDGDRGMVYDLGVLPASLPTTPAFTPDTPTKLPLSLLPSDRYRTLKTKVMVNLSQTQRLAALPTAPIAGVGLLRSEWLLLDILEGRHPWHWVNQGREAELQDRIQQKLEPILQTLGSKPVRYRTLDLRSHEWLALEGSPPAEPNPMLGLRGTLSYNLDPRLFQVELSALAALQRAGYHNIQLILPFVRTVEEVMACHQLVVQTGLTQDSGFALWMMAEVPSVLFLLPAYAKAGVQGIAIGSNDLTQLLLAVDRDQPTLASAYDERHPVVRMAMAHLVEAARRCGMTCSICGQAPVRHPELIADLVAWGINSISVEATALPFTLEAVWHAEQGLSQ
jgi:pyruvate,water dikinase